MRILMTGPWPVAHARHGGQIRAESIIDAYRRQGHEVKFKGIYDPGNVPEGHTTPDDIAINGECMAYIGKTGLPWEISLWDSFANVPSLFAEFEASVRRFRPDIVQFEEPYLWPVVKKLRDRGLLGSARIVHSSYNFETDYRRDLARIANRFDQRVLSHVADQEREISRECDLVITVSDDDARSFEGLGAAQVVVARNGSRLIQPSLAALAAVSAYCGGEPYALFVSSAHPPNAEGFVKFSMAKRENLPGRLVIGGGVYRLLEPIRNSNPILRDAEIVGLVEPDVLQALLACAAVILLPKTSGGGSNLKTSEALMACRPVVATSMAFIGFENWRNALNVQIADDPDTFWKNVAEHLNSPVPRVANNLDAQRKLLLWEACLAPMIAAVEQLHKTTAMQ